MRIYDERGRELVTAEDAARMAGVQTQSFLVRVNRGTAPEPIGQLGRTHLFLADEVRQWVRWRKPTPRRKRRG